MLKLNVFGKMFGVLKIKCYLCNDNYFIKFAASKSSTCKCTQDDDSQTTKAIVKLPKKQRAEGQEYK